MEFLKRCKRVDGASYTEQQGTTIIAQMAKEVDGEVICLEVRKETNGAKGEERQKIIEEAKAEVQEMYRK